MPIGNIDYVSTAPWNDPTNPWPAYAQLTLSAADLTVPSDTYVLNAFDPVAGTVIYNGIASDGNQVINYNYIGVGVWGIYDDMIGLMYTLTTARRSIPAGWLQGNTGWEGDNGSEATSISIIPDTTVLTPWEFRRRRLLEYS